LFKNGHFALHTEPQNRQEEGPSLLEVLTVIFAVAVLILLNVQHIPVIVWLLVFVGFAHLCFFLAIAMPFEPGEDPEPRRREETARTDARLLAAITGLPISTSILMVPMHNDANFFALVNAFYLLSLAFAIRAVRTRPICAGNACKIACLAQVASYLISASVHILDMRLYRLQDALATFDVAPSSIIHIILILIFLHRSPQDQRAPHTQ
jgi:hypothetical protein